MKDYNNFDEASRKMLNDFIALVGQEYLDFFVSTPEQKRCYAVARKLCEGDGHDPDRISMGYERCPAMIDAKGTVAIYHPIRPNWFLYMSDAVRAIEVVESCKEDECSASS